MKSSMLQNKGLRNMIGGKNYNFRQGQGDAVVAQQMQTLAAELKAPNKGIYYATQVHGNHIAKVSVQDIQAAQVIEIEDVDGLITDDTGLVLMIKFADCTPIVIYDPVRKVQASVHSGWRSTQKRISNVAIEMMCTEYGCNLQDLYIYVGPTIDQANYEVGPEVYEAFTDFAQRDRFFKVSSNPGKFMLNMQEANLVILEEAGINMDRVECANVSTYSDQTLHSARRDSPGFGLNAIATMIEA